MECVYVVETFLLSSKLGDFNFIFHCTFSPCPQITKAKLLLSHQERSRVEPSGRYTTTKQVSYGSIKKTQRAWRRKEKKNCAKVKRSERECGINYNNKNANRSVYWTRGLFAFCFNRFLGFSEMELWKLEKYCKRREKKTSDWLDGGV